MKLERSLSFVALHFKFEETKTRRVDKRFPDWVLGVCCYFAESDNKPNDFLFHAP